jgi:hypothetical protein
MVPIPPPPTPNIKNIIFYLSPHVGITSHLVFLAGSIGAAPTPGSPPLPPGSETPTAGSSPGQRRLQMVMRSI